MLGLSKNIKVHHHITTWGGFLLNVQQKARFVSILSILSLFIASSGILVVISAPASQTYSTILEAGSLRSTATYTFFRDGSTYFVKNCTTGEIQDSGTNITLLTNDMIKNRSSRAGEPGGIFHFQPGEYDFDGTVWMQNNVWIRGEGQNSTVFNIKANDVTLINFHEGSDLRTKYASLTDLKIIGATAYTGTTGIYFDGTYCNVENVKVAYVDYGIKINKSEAGDNNFRNIYVYNFRTIGIWVISNDDCMFTDITVGSHDWTEIDATACVKIDEGGSGTHWTNTHIWAVADEPCDYGLLIGNESTFTYQQMWTSTEIEGTYQNNSMYLGSHADMLMFSNLQVRGSETDICIHIDTDASHIQIDTLWIRGADELGMLVESTGVRISGAYIYSNEGTGIQLGNAYGFYNGTTLNDATFFNNGQNAGATPYYDLHVYHGKYMRISNIYCSGSYVNKSVWIEDAYHTQASNIFCSDVMWDITGSGSLPTSDHNSFMFNNGSLLED
jgi:hypothetical protein